MLIGNYNESDELFARRLQAQEMNNYNRLTTITNNIDSQTPLMNRANENPTVIHARLNEATTSRVSLYAILIVNIPQILATFIVLLMHWNDSDVCDSPHTMKWKLWAIFSALRMLSYSAIVCFMEYFRVWLHERRETYEKIKNFRNTIDAFGLIWFVVGNMWLFGDDDNSCRKPNQSPIYNLCVSMIVLNYIQICLPCILAILLIPIMCFCAPCLIRLMARLQDPRANVGATNAVLETLPEVIIDSTHIRPGAQADNNTCPICLSELCIGESARVLRCSHIFHKQCVDEWLRVNASCPTCRKRIIEDQNITSNNNNNNNNSNSSSTNNPLLTTNIATTTSSPTNPMHSLLNNNNDQSSEIALRLIVPPSTNNNNNNNIYSLLSGNNNNSNINEFSMNGISIADYQISPLYQTTANTTTHSNMNTNSYNRLPQNNFVYPNSDDDNSNDESSNV